MTRSKLIVTRAPLLSVTPGALRWLVALATLAAAPLARADAPPAPEPSSPATPAPSDSTTSPSGQVTATSPSGQVNARPAAEPTRCQDRRDREWIRRCTPERGTFELGVFAGVLLPAANSHELFDPYKQRDARRDGQEFWRPYQTAAPDLGLRLAYFPLRFLGGELEGALMPTRRRPDGT